MSLELEPFWTAMDVAKYLRASRSWVYHRAESGEIPHRKIGGLLRFEPARVRAWATGTDNVIPLRKGVVR